MSNNRKICLGGIELTQSSEVEALNGRVSTIEGKIPSGETFEDVAFSGDYNDLVNAITLQDIEDLQ